MGLDDTCTMSSVAQLTCLSTGVSHMRKRLKRPAAPSPVVWGLSWAVTMVTCSRRVRAWARG